MKKSCRKILVGNQRHATMADQEEINLWHNQTALNNITNNQLELLFVYKQSLILKQKFKD